MVYQLVSMAGAVLILAAYAGLQMKRMLPDSILYQVLNAAGGILLCITAVVERQYGFIVLEGSWAVIAGFGLVRTMMTRG